jgi:hypothetical protein
MVSDARTVWKSYTLNLASQRAFEFLHCEKPVFMKELMVLLSILISFPLFMAFSYVVAKAMFPSELKVAADQQRERQLLMQRARRSRKVDRIVPASTQLVPQQLAHA